MLKDIQCFPRYVRKLCEMIIQDSDFYVFLLLLKSDVYLPQYF